MKFVELAKDVCVPKLTVREMIEETEKAWHSERSQLLEDLEASKVTGAERLEAVQQQGRRRGTSLVLLLATIRLDTAERVIRQACVRAQVDADAVLSEMTPRQITDKAAELCGYVASSGNEDSPSQTR